MGKDDPGIGESELSEVWSRTCDLGSHLTNVHVRDSIEAMGRLERDGHREPMSLIRGPAKVTAGMTGEQLKAAGMVGIYSRKPGEPS